MQDGAVEGGGGDVEIENEDDEEEEEEAETDSSDDDDDDSDEDGSVEIVSEDEFSMDEQLANVMQGEKRGGRKAAGPSKE